MQFTLADQLRNIVGSETAVEKQARAFRRANLYGTGAVERLEVLEDVVRKNFDTEFDAHVPNIWPNIPLRF